MKESLNLYEIPSYENTVIVVRGRASCMDHLLIPATDMKETSSFPFRKGYLPFILFFKFVEQQRTKSCPPDGLKFNLYNAHSRNQPISAAYLLF